MVHGAKYIKTVPSSEFRVKSKTQRKAEREKEKAKTATQQRFSLRNENSHFAEMLTG
jgi:hypothetical protein